MKGLHYQLRSVFRDKFCMMTFLLPIVVAAVLNFAGQIDLSPLGELHFGIVKEELPSQTVMWLERYGTVTICETQEELLAAVNEPSTNLIGVEGDGKGIRTILSGDELDVFHQIADTLPALYEQRDAASQKTVRFLEHPDALAGYQDLFIGITLVTAMFMGCTFNAVNIISEKEDGVAFIQEILPMTRGQYMVQKLTIGFLCGSLSSLITACVCFRPSARNAVLMLALIVLSAFVAALAGLWIGRVSQGLMAGVGYLKIVMLLFIAVPVVSFLAGIENPFLSALCYLVPSQAAFEGIMDLAAGSGAAVGKDVGILLAHGAVWGLAYLSIS